MEVKLNSKGHPASCRNCNYWGNMKRINHNSINKKDEIKILIGTCFNANTKLEFIHSGEKTCCIITQANAICDNFKWRIE